MGTETKSATDLFDRYMGYRNPHDAKFAQIVDLLVAHMMQHKIAPDEIRDAAFVASVKFMQMNPVRQIVYKRDDLNGLRFPEKID